MPFAPAATISPSGATATAESGAGSVTMVGGRAVERPDAQGQIVGHAHHRLAVGRERHAVDVLRMPFEHARAPAAERPEPHRVVPRGGGKRGAVRRNAKRDDRRRVPFEHRIGLLFPGAPQRDAPIRAARHCAPVAQQRDRVHGVVVEAQHLLGGIARQRPTNRRAIEAAGDRFHAVGRHRDRAHRPAMAAQLRVRRSADDQRRNDQRNAAHALHSAAATWRGVSAKPS